MGKNVEMLKRVAETLGFGIVDDYKGTTFVDVLKEMAVKMGCSPSTDDIRAENTADVLEFIADNYGSEEKEPYNLSRTVTNVVVTVERKGKAIEDGDDILYNGDMLTITAKGESGYELDTLMVNGSAFVSGEQFKVDGHNVVIVATGKVAKFDLSRTATGCTVEVAKGDADDAEGELSGVYVWHDAPVPPSRHFNYIEVDFFSGHPWYGDDSHKISVDMGSGITYCQEVTVEEGVYHSTTGWQNEAYKTIDFGSKQTGIDLEFWTWFRENADKQGGGSTPVADGTDVLDYQDEITISATPEAGLALKSLTVNGEDFVSGQTLIVEDDIVIEALAE